MKKILLISVFLLISGIVEARNLVTYRPFDWQRITEKVGNGSYEVWYPDQMEWLKDATQAIVEEVYGKYSQNVFCDFKWFTKAADTVIVTDFERLIPGNVKPDSMIGPYKGVKFYDTTTVKNWYDYNRAIVVYPSLQDFTQEKVIPTIMPPGILGFNETINFRVVVPFPGSYNLYKNVLYHELAHAWMFSFMATTAKKCKLRVDASLYQCPLWFVEGWAQFLNRRYNQDFNPDYMSVIEENMVRRGVGDLEMKVPKLAEMDGMDVYTFGYSFVNWIVDQYGMKKLVKFLSNRPRFYFFEDAWYFTFKKSVEDMEMDWHKSLRYQYFKNVYDDSLNSDKAVEKVKKSPLFTGYAYYENGKIAYYTEDPKWGERIEVKDLPKDSIKDSINVFNVHHIFEDKSLWYREDNPPAISGNLTAIVVNREGQDELRIYRLAVEKVRRHLLTNAKKILVLRSKSILTITAPAFDFSGEKIVFEGIDLKGFSDLYVWDLKTKKIERLVEDYYYDFWPRFAELNGQKVIIFASDRASKEKYGLFALNLETKKITCLYQPENQGSFVDQPTPYKDLVAFRYIELNHSPRIFIWHDNKVHQIFSSFEGISQIVGFMDDTTLLCIKAGKLAKIHLQPLETYPTLTTENKEMASGTWQIDTPAKPVKPTREKGWPYKYEVPLGNLPGYATATGEKIWIFDLGFNAGNSQVSYNVLWGTIDLSSRLQKTYLLHAYQYYNYRLVKGYDIQAVLDNSTTFSANFYYPFDIENGIGLGLASGYMRRTYPYRLDDIALNPGLMAERYSKKSSSMVYDQGWQKYYTYSERSPILETGLYFTHDQTFGSYGEVRRGSYLEIQFDPIFFQDKILEGTFSFDGRYYLQLGNTRALLANRIFCIKSFGMDRRMFVGYSDIYKSLFPNLLSDVLQLQTEFRFPILNWIAVQPAWCKIGSGSGIGFRVNGSLYWYTGDTWYGDEKIEWTTRMGASIKLMVMNNVSLSYDRYRYLRMGLKDQWRNGIFFTIDF